MGTELELINNIYHNNLQDEMFFLIEQFSTLEISSDTSSITSLNETDSESSNYDDALSRGLDILSIGHTLPSFMTMDDPFPINGNLIRRLLAGDSLYIEDLEFISSRSAFYVLDFLDHSSNVPLTRRDIGMYRILGTVFLNNFLMSYYD